jgi:hypothetical protein
MEYILNLDFNDDPDYQMLIHNFQEFLTDKSDDQQNNYYRMARSGSPKRGRKLSSSIFSKIVNNNDA